VQAPDHILSDREISGNKNQSEQIPEFSGNLLDTLRIFPGCFKIVSGFSDFFRLKFAHILVNKVDIFVDKLMQ
jgi:hypothetical protein